MKRFLLSALALGVCLGASADKAPSNAVKGESLNSRNAASAAPEVARPLHSISKAGEDWQYLGEGTYRDGIFYGIGYYDEDPGEITVRVEKCGDKYRITNLWPEFGVNTQMVVDMTDPNFGIVENQSSGYNDPESGDTRVASLSWLAMQQNWYKNVIINEYPDNIITMKDNVIYFPGNSVWLQWPADEQSWYKSASPKDGWLALPGGVPTGSEWEYAGLCEYTDGVMAPFLVNFTPRKQTLPIEKNTRYEGKYRVKNPFGVYVGGEQAEDLVFDISDPEHVQIPNQSTGIVGDEWLGITRICGTGSGMSVEEFIESDYYEDGNSTYDPATFTVTIPPMGLLYNFPESIDEDFPTYMWHFLLTQKGPATTIVLPDPASVKGIGVGTADDAVRYYNMQGVALSAPVKGEPVIEVRGGKASKKVFK